MTGLIKISPAHDVRSKACVLCANQNARAIYRYLYDGGESLIKKCADCGHLFIEPVPLPSLPQRRMDSVNDAEMFASAFLRRLYERFVIGRELQHIRRYAGNTDGLTVLDIGCGTGWTSALWQKNGFRVTGLEPSTVRAHIASEKYGLTVAQSSIEEYQPEQKFDIVIMRHLLEHIENPVAVLSKVRSFLKKDGALLVILPNINCIGRYLFKENWEWILPWHLHFYSPSTARRLMERSGFMTAELFQVPSPLWYANSFQRWMEKKGKNVTWLKNIPFPVRIMFFLPIITIGMIINANDNLTLIAKIQNPPRT